MVGTQNFNIDSVTPFFNKFLAILEQGYFVSHWSCHKQNLKALF